MPSPAAWSTLGVDLGEEIHGGKQSRVFAAKLGGSDVALKLTDAGFADAKLMTHRLQAQEVLAATTHLVVAPVRFDNELVHPLDDWLVSATEFADGGLVDITRADDVLLMARTLAELHQRLRSLPQLPIPPVAPLRTTGPRSGADRSGWQLLHGDFSDRNVVVTEYGLRVFDFDDCGYGPLEYDLANSLYMVLFDAHVSDRNERYEVFRSAFLRDYAEAAAMSIDIDRVDSLITQRITVLGQWLDDLTAAPVGIRTASADWHDTLRAFVTAHSA